MDLHLTTTFYVIIQDLSPCIATRRLLLSHFIIPCSLFWIKCCSFPFLVHLCFKVKVQTASSSAPFPVAPKRIKNSGETHFGAAPLAHSLCVALASSPRPILGILRWRQRPRQQLHPPSLPIPQFATNFRLGLLKIVLTTSLIT